MTNLRPSSITAVFVFLLTAFCLLPSALAQTATATLSGTVEDEKGAVVPGVTVAVLNVDTSFRRESTTNETGSFLFTLLPPGHYSLTAERQGFKVLQVPSIVLNVGDQKALKIELQTGNITETVRITGEAPLINESPAVATTIDRQFAGNLPLNGRSFQSLILLTPGVAVASSSSLDNGQFSVNGQRANANYLALDGVAANFGVGSVFFSSIATAQDGGTPALTAFGGTSNLISLDALEEFKIQTSSYAAEFGRQLGGQITLVSRSGTNRFHGTVFDYLRNDALDARNYFNTKPAPKPALRQNDFGGTFSGPVFIPGLYAGRDRTFFFFSYEGLRLRLPQSGIANVPSVRLRQIAAPALRPILNAFPVPTGPELLSGAGLPLGFAPYNFALSEPSSSNATSIRLDHTISSKTHMFGRFNESPSNTLSRAVTTLTTPTRAAASTRTATFGLTSALTSELSNELRLNYSRQQNRMSRLNDPVGGASAVDIAALTSGYTGTGITFGNITVLLSGRSSSLLLGDQDKSRQEQINVVDNVSLKRGAHILKFGIDYRRLSPLYAPTDYSQVAQLRNETDIRNGNLSRLDVNANSGARPIFSNLSLYAQDTWRFSSRLTMDLGLRWEFVPPPHEATGKKPAQAVGIDDIATATLAPPDAPFYKTSYAGFGPRVGIAYQLSRVAGRETVLRGGFGVYYDLGTGQATNGFVQGFPFRVTRRLTAVPYPVSASQAVPPGFPEIKLPINGTVFSIDPDLKLPLALQWNIAVEQALGRGQSLTLSYVASAGRRLLTTRQLNFPPNLISGAPPNPNFQEIDFTANGATSDYHSLQVQYKTRLKHGLQAILNYTWSHAIDDISQEVVDTGGNLQRSNADFDIRHNLSTAVTYRIPNPKVGRLFSQILSGWSLDTIVHLQSGRPVNLTTDLFLIGSNGSASFVRPDLVGGVPLYVQDPTVPGGRRFNAAAFKAPPLNPTDPLGLTAVRQGSLSRNILRELALYQADVALGRTFRLRESLNLQIKAEVFNLFNHPMFGQYGSNITSPSTLGVPSATLNRSLGGLSSLYQIGGSRSIQISMRLSF